MTSTYSTPSVPTGTTDALELDSERILERIFGNVHECNEFLSSLVTPLKELEEKYDAELAREIACHRSTKTRAAMSEQEEKRLRELQGQRKALKENVETIKRENEMLEERLRQQGKETASRFGFHFEPADAGKNIEQQYKDLFEEARMLSDELLTLAQKCKQVSEEDKKNRLPLIIHCLNEMFKSVCQASTNNYEGLQRKLNSLIEDIGLKAEKLTTNAEILSHIIRHTAMCAHPKQAAQGQTLTPEKFKQEALLSWEDFKARGEYQTIKNYVSAGQKWQVFEENRLKPFIEKCCDFCWQWLLFQGRGEIIGLHASSINQDHFELLPGFQQSSGKNIVWCALLDHQSALIHKGYFV